MPRGRRRRRHSPAQYGGGGAGGGGAPPAFDPGTVSGLTHWYNADSLALTDGNAVATWEDDVGSLDATEATNRPTYKTAANGINSKPVVRFDGSNDALTTGAFTQAQPYSIAVVVRHATGSVAANQQMVAGANTSNSIPEFYINNASPDSYSLYAGSVISALTAAIDTNAHIVIGIFNGASSELWVDGTQHALSGTPGAGAWNGDAVYIGHINNTQFLNGDLAQVQLINGAISTADRNSLETAWGTTYSITVA